MAGNIIGSVNRNRFFFHFYPHGTNEVLRSMPIINEINFLSECRPYGSVKKENFRFSIHVSAMQYKSNGTHAPEGEWNGRATKAKKSTNTHHLATRLAASRLHRFEETAPTEGGSPWIPTTILSYRKNNNSITSSFNYTLLSLSVISTSLINFQPLVTRSFLYYIHGPITIITCALKH